MTDAFDVGAALLYQDDYLLIVNKPAGAVVHRSPEHKDATVILLQSVRNWVGQHVHALHRLDRPTSGAVLFAKAPEHVPQLQDALTAGSKRYLAMVRQLVAPDGFIDRPLKNEETGLPQEARTRFRRVAAYDLGGGFGTASLVEASIETGRRHQIRRHFAALAHQLLLDTRYGKGGINRYCRDTLGLPRLFLHAFGLSFLHPWTQEPLAVEAPLPDDLTRFLARLTLVPVPQGG